MSREENFLQKSRAQFCRPTSVKVSRCKISRKICTYSVAVTEVTVDVAAGKNSVVVNNFVVVVKTVDDGLSR